MQDVLTKAQNGDIKAFEEIITSYEKYIYVIAYNIMGNKEDAMDASQEVAIKIYRNLKSCKGENFLKPWIGRITHNACMDALRKRKGKETFSLDEMQSEEDGKPSMQFKDVAPGPEALLLQKELSVQIRGALQKLPTNLQALIVLRDIQDHSYEEIVQILDLPEGTVKSRLFRARAKLKELLIAEQIGVSIRHDI